MDNDMSYAVSNTEASANLKLDNSVTDLPQVSLSRKEALSELGIANIRDVLNYFPRDFIDLSCVSTVEDSKIGFNYTLFVNVHSVEEKEPKPGVKLIEITVTDDTGTLIATCFNQKWLLESVKPNDKVAIAGKVEFNYGFKRMTNPFIYVADKQTDSTEIAKIIPIYTASKKLSSSWIRRIVDNAFSYVGNLVNPINEDIVKKYRLMNYYDALKKCHFPGSMDELSLARRSVKYYEVLTQQCWLLNSNVSSNFKLISTEFVTDKIDNAIQAISLYKDGGSQSILMTSSCVLLAQYKKIMLEKFKELNVAFAALDENSSKENIWKAIYDFKNGHLDAIICTSYLLKEKIEYKNLGLLIIDEKTNFKKSVVDAFININNDCDTLYLSSKPITKTMSKLIYPNCELLSIPYKTSHECNIKVYNKDDIAYSYDEALKFSYSSGQICIVCPLVGVNSQQRNILAGIKDADVNVKISDKEINYDVVAIDNSSDKDINNSSQAINKFKVFENKIFSECTSGLIHSQMNVKDKLKILDEFECGNIDVLVCACEPDFIIKSKNKLMIIVEDADRIGLSKLHQLRNYAILNGGDSLMHLISASKQKISLNRLNLMKDIMDGDSLVKKDLEMRKDGATLGLSEWGFNYLKLINFVRDYKIIDTANKDAKEIIEQDPKLNNSENKLFSYEISRIFNS